MSQVLAVLARAWDWVKRVWALERRVGELERRVAEIQAARPPRPEDLGPHHGVWWGRYPPKEHPDPHCGACAADGKYVVMEADWGLGQRIRLCCPKCRHTLELSESQWEDAGGAPGGPPRLPARPVPRAPSYNFGRPSRRP